MPKLPQYNSKGNLTTQAPEAPRTGAGQTAEAIGNVAGVIGNIALQMQKTKNTIDSNRAMLTHEYGVKAIETEAINQRVDPTVDNYEEEWNKAYSLKLNKLREESLSKIRNPRYREQVAFKIDHDSKVAQLNIQKTLLKKQVDFGKASMLARLELVQSEYINAQNEIEQIQARNHIEEIVSDGVVGGFYSYEDGKKLVESTIKEAQDSLKNSDALMRVKEKELQRAINLAQTDKAIDMINMKLTGQTKDGVFVTREDMLTQGKRDVELGLMSPEFYNAFKTAITSPMAVDSLRSDKDFGKIMEMISDPNASYGDVLLAIQTMRGYGNLTDGDEKKLTEFINMLTKYAPDDLVVEEIKKQFGVFGKLVSAENEKELNDKSRKSLTRMGISYIDKIITGVPPQTASLEVRREEVLHLHGSAKTAGKEGIIVMDMFGNRRRILPNGDTEVVPNSTPLTEKKPEEDSPARGEYHLQKKPEKK